MLHLWKQTSEKLQAETRASDTDPSANNMDVAVGPPAKKRKTTPTLLPGMNGLPRPTITSEDVFAQLEHGNGDYSDLFRTGLFSSLGLSVIAVVENHEGVSPDQTSGMQRLITFHRENGSPTAGARTEHRRSAVHFCTWFAESSGCSLHCRVSRLYRATGPPQPADSARSDNQSIGQYAKELEELDFSVGSYTVSMHSSGVNQWPDIIYNDVVVVAANVSAACIYI